MVSNNEFRKMALSLKDSVELPHFEITSFRINKKVFATLDERISRACLMLNEIDQSVFCSFDPDIIYPVPNAWGKKGATYFELDKVRKDMMRDALNLAYQGKAKPARK